MEWYEIFCFVILVITHACAYYWGANGKPSDNAWLAVQCHYIDKRFEHERWLKEHADETEEAAASGD